MPDIYTADLRTTIAKAESNGNYNAYFGNSRNTEIQFTKMTIAEVFEWQRQFVAAGNASSAVGRYQFIDTTLQGLVKSKGIDPQSIFNEATQDVLADALLERRGLRDYIEGDLSRDEFAHNLSKEWAALPRVIGDSPAASYYAGDGLNASRTSIDEIYKAIATVRVL
jgi:conjugal transfer mating pair stabilization protein TraG